MQKFINDAAFMQADISRTVLHSYHQNTQRYMYGDKYNDILAFTLISVMRTPVKPKYMYETNININAGLTPQIPRTVYEYY